jgi:hypothetical protein
MVIWSIFPVLVSFSKKNLATIRTNIFVQTESANAAMGKSKGKGGKKKNDMEEFEGWNWEERRQVGMAKFLHLININIYYILRKIVYFIFHKCSRQDKTNSVANMQA